MKKMINPFVSNCIGCSSGNRHGLHLEFQYDEERKALISKWQPRHQFEGYTNVLHGGIQTLMIDEIAAWSVYIFLETAGVTKKLSSSFLSPVYISNGMITLESCLKSSDKRNAIFSVKLYDGKGNLCTTGEAEYFIYPQTIAKKKFHYPGVDAFFEN
ncbi:MAG: PaaI family thioesterase [Candidatus Marinimicrobia bacterium]|nr:PaaI family thioesterase [Candidatus Neomarinimicrobiota bacterium]